MMTQIFRSGDEKLNATQDDINKAAIHRGIVIYDNELSSSLLDRTQRW